MTYFSFFGGCLALLLFLRQLLRLRKGSSRMVLFLFLGLAWSQFRSFFSGSVFVRGEAITIPLLTVLVLSGLAAHFFLIELARPDWQWKSVFGWSFLLLLPAFLVDIFIVFPELIRSPGLAFGLESSHWVGGAFLILSVSAGLIKLFAGFSFREMDRTSRFVLFLSVYVLSAVVCGLIGLALNNILLLNISSLSFSALLVIVFLNSDLKPELLQRFKAEIRRNRYRKTTLAGVDKDRIGKRLEAMMIRDKFFADPDCTLDSLSSALGLSSHQLSEYLNNDLGISFPSYIKQYRIEEAKVLLQKQPGKSVLEIAFEVGFGSKTTFNEAFRQSVGSTPLIFRKKVRDDNP